MSVDATDVSLLVELFTSSHLQLLAWHGRTKVLAASIPVITKRTPHLRRKSLGALFDHAFEILRREYPVEYVFKACLLRKNVFGIHSPSTASMYLEFAVGEARADALLINGAARVFEVKTRFDDPSRLQQQVDQYFRCFTEVSLVVDEREAGTYAELVPEHVGVIGLTRRFCLKQVRAAQSYKEGLDQVAMFSLLRQDEYVAIGERLGLDLSAIDPAERYTVVRERFAQLPSVTAHERVVQALRDRQATEQLARLCANLPQSLHAGVFGYRLRKRDWLSLREVMSVRLSTA